MFKFLYSSFKKTQPDNGGVSHLNLTTLYEDKAHVEYNSNNFNDVSGRANFYYVCELNLCSSWQYFDTSSNNCSK